MPVLQPSNPAPVKVPARDSLRWHSVQVKATFSMAKVASTLGGESTPAPNLRLSQSSREPLASRHYIQMLWWAVEPVIEQCTRANWSVVRNFWLRDRTFDHINSYILLSWLTCFVNKEGALGLERANASNLLLNSNLISRFSSASE